MDAGNTFYIITARKGCESMDVIESTSNEVPKISSDHNYAKLAY